MHLKELFEKRAAKQAEMKAILDLAKSETRSLTEEENGKFDELEKEIRELDATIKAIQTSRELELDAPEEETGVEERDERTVEQRDYDVFNAYIRGQLEERGDVNMTKDDNGAVIPSSIANKIIEKVVELSPVFALADRYNVGGTLNIPYYDETTQKITMDYANEFTDGESTSGKFLSISLTGHLGRAITDVSKSLINNSNFDIVSYVVDRMAVAIAEWIDKELLKGTTGKIAGLTGVTQNKSAASATAVTSDELIDVQALVPDAYQNDAIWIMSRNTRNAIRKLRDGQNNYLLNRDFEARWGYRLLGKDVYVSKNMDDMATGKVAIYYGDMKGLAVKVSEDITIEVLREVKARQHAVEILGFVELDAKVQNTEMLSKLTMA